MYYALLIDNRLEKCWLLEAPRGWRIDEEVEKACVFNQLNGEQFSQI